MNGLNFDRFLSVPLDYFSVVEKLSTIECRPTELDRSVYCMDYADLFNELSLLAAQLYRELDRLIYDLIYRWDFPRRVSDTYENATGVVWFDTASSLISATDMDLLMENEGRWGGDMDTERDRRVRAVKHLTKEQMFRLFTEVFHFLMGFFELNQAYEAICGMVDELERLHSYRERDGKAQLPPSAYL